MNKSGSQAGDFVAAPRSAGRVGACGGGGCSSTTALTDGTAPPSALWLSVGTYTAKAAVLTVEGPLDRRDDCHGSSLAFLFFPSRQPTRTTSWRMRGAAGEGPCPACGCCSAAAAPLGCCCHRGETIDKTEREEGHCGCNSASSASSRQQQPTSSSRPPPPRPPPAVVVVVPRRATITKNLRPLATPRSNHSFLSLHRLLPSPALLSLASLGPPLLLLLWRLCKRHNTPCAASLGGLMPRLAQPQQPRRAS